MGTAEHSN